MNKDVVITSRQNPGVKRAAALLEKKEREKSGLFRFDGIKLLHEAISCGIEIETVYIRESSFENMCERFSDNERAVLSDKAVCLADTVFEKISEEKSPEGIITLAKHIDKFRKNIKIDIVDMPGEGESVLLLEALRDPGNLGTILRSAAALGVDRVVMSSDCADIYNPKTIRAAMGGIFRLRVDSVASLEDYIILMRQSGRRVFAAALDERARVLGSFESKAGDCFVVGNEGHGLSAGVIAACDGSVIIPMEEGCESLNAACAAVILMWEMRRSK